MSGRQHSDFWVRVQFVACLLPSTDAGYRVAHHSREEKECARDVEGYIVTASYVFQGTWEKDNNLVKLCNGTIRVGSQCR